MDSERLLPVVKLWGYMMLPPGTDIEELMCWLYVSLILAALALCAL